MSAHSLGENREKQTREYSKKGLYAFLAKIVLGLSTLIKIKISIVKRRNPVC